MANGTGTNGHIQGLKLEDGWAVVEDPGFGNRREYIQKLGRWIKVRKARVDADSASTTEKLNTISSERDKLAQRVNFAGKVLDGSGIEKLIDYAQTALQAQDPNKTPSSAPPLPYVHFEQTLSKILTPLLDRGYNLAAQVSLNVGNEFLKVAQFVDARVIYEHVRTHPTTSLSLGAEMGLLAIKEARKGLTDLDEKVLGPEIDASFERFVREDPTLTIGKYIKEALSSATQGGVTNQTSAAAFFIRASYQARNNKQWDDSTKGLMREALTRDSSLVDAALQLASHYHNSSKPNDSIAQGIMSVIYVSSEKTADKLRIRIGLDGLSIYDSNLSNLVTQMTEHKNDYDHMKQARMQLTQQVRASPASAEPIYHAAVALQLQKEFSLAEEVAIALANATNEPKYWKLIGDIVSQSPTKDKPARASWAQECYQKAKI